MRDSIKESLDLYADEGIAPGGFLVAVLSNDLMDAMGRADLTSRVELFEICEYIYNDMPSACHGSRAKVKAWIATRSAERNVTLE